MPKDEFDPQDPLELNGLALLTEEDTTEVMCECFIEEFMRMGYGPQRILALFSNPNYLGPHMLLEKRGAQFVRNSIAQTFARWGRPLGKSEVRNPKSQGGQELPASAALSEADTAAADPPVAPFDPQPKTPCDTSKTVRHP